MFLKKILPMLLFAAALCAPAQVQVAVFSLNDFHGAFVRNDYKDIPGAPAILQTLDSLKRVYPLNVTVSAGDNFGGSYFYNATHGVLLPSFFSDLGINISAVGNHEFDDGQRSLGEKWQGSPLRPSGWDITYVCSNVRSTKSGRVPDFCQPVASVPITLPNGKTFRIAFVGLLSSSTPQQASARKVAGLTFDGNYPAVLDSVMHLPEASLVNGAQLRLLLTHIGTFTDRDGHPAWTDPDSAHLAEINSSLWHGVLSSHSHKHVCGHINAARLPIVQGRWHGNYISMLLCTVDTTTLRVTHVEPRTIAVTPKAQLEAEPARLQAQIDSLLQNTCTVGGTPIGEVLTQARATLDHDRDNKYCQTEVGTIVCRAYAEAWRKAAHLSPDDVVIGANHFMGIRAGFTEGPISVLDVGEVLPFSNALKAYSLTGKQLMEIIEFGLHNERYGQLQTGYLQVTCDADSHVTALTYQSPQGKCIPLKAKKKYVLVVDEYITTGGDGYSPNFFPASQELKAEGVPVTTDALINYLREQTSI